jgi:hypothetical protein
MARDHAPTKERRVLSDLACCADLGGDSLKDEATALEGGRIFCEQVQVVSAPMVQVIGGQRHVSRQ